MSTQQTPHKYVGDAVNRAQETRLSQATILRKMQERGTRSSPMPSEYGTYTAVTAATTG